LDRALEEPGSGELTASIAAHVRERKNEMQVTQTQNEGLKRGYRIVVPGQSLIENVEKRLASEQPNFHLNGFRKGKVPTWLIRKIHGKEIEDMVWENAIREALSDHFKESGEKPMMSPTVEIENDGRKDGGDLSFNVAYEARPVIPEVDFRSIQLERMMVSVDDASVQNVLEARSIAYGTHEDAETGATAQFGDLVIIDFEGTIDGEEFEGGSGEGFPVQIGGNLIAPGFDAQLVGSERDSTVDIEVTYPEDHHNEPLRGKDASFSCMVRELKKIVPNPIDDSLATKMGFENLERLKENIRDSLRRGFRDEAKLLMRYQLFNRLSETLDFELPPSLLSKEVANVARQIAEDAEDRSEDQADSDDGNGSAEADGIEPTPEHIALAGRRLRLGLTFVEVGEANGIKVNEQDLELAAERMSHRHGQASKAEYLSFLYNHEGIRSNVEQEIFERKVVDFLIELADVTDREVSVDEFREALAAMDE